MELESSKENYKEFSLILRPRTIKDKTEYLIQWENTKKQTWEPLKNFKYRHELFSLYYLEQEGKFPEEGKIEIDRPKKILSSRKKESGVIIFMVEWEKRLNGYKPKNSEVLYLDMLDLFPAMLTSYYIQGMILESPLDSEEDIKKEKVINIED